MKGNRLFNMLSTLSKKEHRQFINHCKIQPDKRFADLIRLLKIRHLTKKKFESFVEGLYQQQPSASRTDKDSRRWIDFCCKEIEKFVLHNHITADFLQKNIELAKYYHSINQAELAIYYTQIALPEARKKAEHSAVITLLDIIAKNYAKTQYKNDMTTIEHTLHQKLNTTKLLYHELMSANYTIASSIYLDNPTENAKEKTADINRLISDTHDEYQQILYKLSLCRYCFLTEKKFKPLIASLINQVSVFELKDLKQFQVFRSTVYLYIIGGMYYGSPTEQLTSYATITYKYLERYKIYDTMSVFFLLFLLIIMKDFATANQIIKAKKNLYFNEENMDYLHFIHCFMAYCKAEGDQKLSDIVHLSYSKSSYVAMWSKVLEICIHIQAGDMKFAEVLIQRSKRFITQNKDKPVVAFPAKKVILILEKIVNRKISPASIDYDAQLFDYYNVLLLSLKQNQ